MTWVLIVKNGFYVYVFLIIKINGLQCVGIVKPCSWIKGKSIKTVLGQQSTEIFRPLPFCKIRNCNSTQRCQFVGDGILLRLPD